MDGGIYIRELEKKALKLIEEDPDLFLVEVKITPINNIKIFIDGDKGISIEKLARFNRSLYRQVEEEKMFPNDDFSLELSSPGLDEPLKLYRQYLKNLGREIEIIEKDGQKKEGKLITADESEIVLEETSGDQRPGKAKKNKEKVTFRIPFDNIKMTKVKIKF